MYAISPLSKHLIPSCSLPHEEVFASFSLEGTKSPCKKALDYMATLYLNHSVWPIRIIHRILLQIEKSSHADFQCAIQQLYALINSLPHYPPLGLHVGKTRGFDSVLNGRCAPRVGDLTIELIPLL